MTPGSSPSAAHADAVAAAEAFAASVRAGAAQRDQAGAVPYAELAAFDSSGLPAVTVPVTDGGAGLGPRTLAEVTRIIAAADPALAQIPQGHYLAVDILGLIGTPEQRERILPAVVSGGRIAPVLAERGGHHAQDLKTRLIPDTTGWRLEGTKYYCTGAITSRWLAASALDPDDRVVLAFVERDAPGVFVDEDWAAMGQRATVSGTTTFDGVRVEDTLVAPYWSVFTRPQLLGARAQLVHAAIEAGIAQGALADAREFVRTRSRPFFEAVRAGQVSTAADDPHTRWRFGRLATHTRAAVELLRWAAGVLDELGLDPANPEAAARGSIAVAQAKTFASDTAVDVASQLFPLTGASGTDRRFALDRHWRNARTHSVHDPVDWKYHHIGAWELADVPPPNHAQI
ncbi:SfnB family sulfur acquisition oxidoreductase [Mycobacterium intermedium]|uniref:Dibenzothiophene monooxygenase n=1 Tax=Mycobacterium intermedium TaxID=28445 RepID=A0A1E3SPI0_MYCIE|nr:acyl-CoA dehydrogenase family protein [Mycobacterium intermedium]MCV6967135.1 acyl-CoA dehydrogenase family protein [Mycobacterium intermedium]ODR03428.1 SfnB family sulfur acquisition oxidoreductase [Mycobacterium intermedium]OPE48897.1 SfnB family sulfur acquisition oxidoreductase [Mycobacterium intermedium]ORB05161.1 SfnB family sulfur acquisition oxidoreductase [Mycobacterium intermedium]